MEKGLRPKAKGFKILMRIKNKIGIQKKFNIPFSHNQISHLFTFLHCRSPQGFYVWFLLTKAMKTSKAPNKVG